MAHSAGRDALPEAALAAAVDERPPAGADPRKRRRILDAAVRTFGRRGFHEARIAEIAAAAKVAEGTVYLYFRNKEDLLGVVFDESMDEVLEKGRALARSKAPAGDRLTALVDLHLKFIGSDRDLASVFQIELRRSARLVERFSRSKLVEYFRLLGDVLRDGIARGEFRRGLDPKLAVRILFGAADEILSEWLLSGEKKPIADARQLVGTLLSGFAEGEGRFASKGKRAARAAAPPKPQSPFEARAEGANSPKVKRAHRPADAQRRKSPFEARGEAANGGRKSDKFASMRRSNPQ
jgi:TetR/AcrR family fatty acid metabolism transcriptional regulator